MAILHLLIVFLSFDFAKEAQVFSLSSPFGKVHSARYAKCCPFYLLGAVSRRLNALRSKSVRKNLLGRAVEELSFIF